MSIGIGLCLMIFAVLSLLAVFVLKSSKLLNLNYLFIFQLIVCFILITLTVSVVNSRQFEKDLKKMIKTPELKPGDTPEKLKEAWESWLKRIDVMNNNFKCCIANDPDADWPEDQVDKLLLPNSCCDSSQLVEKDPFQFDARCPVKKAKESCYHKFLNKQQGFRAAAVVCLTLAIIFQLQLSFNFYNRQGE